MRARQSGAAFVELLLMVPLALLLISVVVDYAYTLERRAQVRTVADLIGIFSSTLQEVSYVHTLSAVPQCGEPLLQTIAEGLPRGVEDGLREILERAGIVTSQITLKDVLTFYPPEPPSSGGKSTQGGSSSTNVYGEVPPSQIDVPFELNVQGGNCAFCLLSGFGLLDVRARGVVHLTCYRSTTAEAKPVVALVP